MNRAQIVGEVMDYFKSDQWNALLDLYRHPSEEVYHIHIFVNNAIDLNSLSPIVAANLKKQGLPIDRKIDLTSPRPGLSGLHSVHPFGPQPGFDMFGTFKEGIALKPMPPAEGEEGKNLIWWGKGYMDTYLKQFEFKCVGPKERRIIQQYFVSKHWKELLYLVEDPRVSGVTHVHGNYELSIDPEVFALFTIEEMKKIGWQVGHYVPCVYHMKKGYQGKIIFLMAHPEEVWDIAWQYNPNVVLQPAEDWFDLPARPDFDIWTQAMLQNTLSKHEFVTLTEKETTQILSSF